MVALLKMIAGQDVKKCLETFWGIPTVNPVSA
jgi:hypothetical protein